MRLVLDTNVIISGFLSLSGPPARLLDLWDENRFYTLVSSEEQITELLRVVEYPKLKSRLNLVVIQDWVFTLRRFGVMLVDLPVVEASPDPNDNFLLAMAQAGQADFLVTGDKRDLLSLNQHGSTLIVTARAAVDRLGG